MWCGMLETSQEAEKQLGDLAEEEKDARTRGEKKRRLKAHS